jgi:FkbM family methyltransferase
MDFEFIGSDYGGWAIDTSRINSESVIYSFGVGEDVTFDLALIFRFGVKVHAFDPTPRAGAWVTKMGFPKKFIFRSVGLSTIDGTEEFLFPSDPSHVSLSSVIERGDPTNKVNLPVKKLSSFMVEFGHEKIDVLKMDIEGSEYSVIEQLSMEDIRPKQILVEFHHRFDNIGVRKTKMALSSLRKMGYKIFSVSNTGEEYSLILSEI